MVTSLSSIFRVGIHFQSNVCKSIQRFYTQPKAATVTSRRMAKLMDAEKAKEIIDSVDSFLFDCDGVLWDGSGLITGSLETITKLKERGKKVFYVTNNSSKSRQDYLKKCRSYGFPAELDDIVCTAYIAAEYLHKINYKDKVYLIGKEESMGHELQQLGIEYTGTGPDPIQGEVEQWLTLKLDPEIKCVVVGFDPHISYMKMMRAASYLKNPDCLFVATNEDSFLPVKEENICIPGTGCMVGPVALAAGRRPVVMGKPETNMFEVLTSVHNLDPSRCMMTGDRIDTDIVFAKKCGLRSFLVLSGVATKANVTDPKDKPGSAPEFYADNLAQFGQFL